MKDAHLTTMVLTIAALCLLAGGYFYWRDNHAYNHPRYLDRLQRTVDNWPSPALRGSFRMTRTPHCEGGSCRATLLGVSESGPGGSVIEFDCKVDPCKELGALYHLDP